MKHSLILITLITTVLYADNIRLSESDKSTFSYRLKVETKVIETRDNDTEIQIKQIRGSQSKFIKGGSYLIYGKLKTKFPDETTIYSGVSTKSGKGGAVDVFGYSRSYYPNKDNSYFKVAFTAIDQGQLHVSAYKKELGGNTDWSEILFRIEILNKLH